MSINPVVVRRIMGSLRDQGFVSSIKGHNGGWTLSKPLKHITLLDVHQALGDKSVFTIGLSDEHTSCLIEQAINNKLQEAMDKAEQILLDSFAEVSLDQLAFNDKVKQLITGNEPQ